MAPTTASIGRSLLSLRHRSEQQVHSMDGHDSPDSDPILSFDRQASSLLLSLLPAADADDAASFLSVSWIGKLLRSFLLLLDDFSALLLLRANLQTSPPLSRLLSDFFDRSVKALDLLNAVRDGLDRVRHCSAHLDIVVPALSDGRLHRARKSLSDLSLLLLGEADPVLPSRNRSFNHDPDGRRRRQLRTALSWSVSRSWSAARQLQAMGSNLSPPKPADISGTAGLAIPIFTISSVLLFVSWVLVAAIPCQDRGLQAHLSVPRNYPWAAPMASLQEKILEEHRKRERKDHGTSGLMRELSVIEKGTRSLIELLERPVAVAVADEGLAKERQLRELEGVREGLKEGLEGLERQLREVFHRIVRSRTEGLDCLSRSSSH